MKQQFVYALFGAALLMPLHLYFKAGGYFRAQLRYDSIPGWISASSMGFNLAASTILTALQRQRPVTYAKKRLWFIVFPLLVQMTLVLACFALMLGIAAIDRALAASIVLFIVSLSGAVLAFIQDGMYSELPTSMAAWFQGGQSLSGLFVSIATIALESMPIRAGLVVYVGTTVLVLGSATWVYRGRPLAKSDAGELEHRGATPIDWLRVIIWAAAMVASLGFTLFVYPSLFILAAGSNTWRGFLPLAFIMYDLGDITGKAACTVLTIRKRWLLIWMPLIRIVMFLPALLYTASVSNVLAFQLACFLFSAAGGFTLTSLLMQVDQWVEPGHSMTGSIIAFTINVGLTIGAVLSIGMSSLYSVVVK